MHEVKVNKFRFIPTTCMLCGSDNHRDHYVIDKYEQGKLYFVRCNHCGTRYQNPMPDQPSMAEFYHSQSFFSAKASSGPLTGYQDYDAQENIRHINARKRLAEIEGLFPAKKKLRILKVACGYGTLVKLARNCGHEAEGIDFSDVMVKGAKQRYDIDLIHADFLEYDFGDRTYDAVLLYGAINNFLRPLDVAQKALTLLNPGGFYVVNHVWPDSLPEMLLGRRYWIYRPPIIGLYPERAFNQYHEQIGFELHKTKYDVQHLTLERLFGYLQARPLIRFIKRSGLSRLGMTIPIPGYARVFLKNPA